MEKMKTDNGIDTFSLDYCIERIPALSLVYCFNVHLFLVHERLHCSVCVGVKFNVSIVCTFVHTYTCIITIILLLCCTIIS